jgi:hypothetical protein
MPQLDILLLFEQISLTVMSLLFILFLMLHTTPRMIIKQYINFRFNFLKLDSQKILITVVQKNNKLAGSLGKKEF